MMVFAVDWKSLLNHLFHHHHQLTLQGRLKKRLWEEQVMKILSQVFTVLIIHIDLNHLLIGPLGIVVPEKHLLVTQSSITIPQCSSLRITIGKPLMPFSPLY